MVWGLGFRVYGTNYLGLGFSVEVCGLSLVFRG